MWGFILSSIAAGLIYEFIYKPYVSPAAAAVAGTFTAAGTVQVGDVVTVALASVDSAATETQLVSPAGSPMPPIPTAAEISVITQLDAAAPTGRTAQFSVTAIGLTGLPGTPSAGVPVVIGILKDPAITTRIPFSFLAASVQSITRNGVVVK